LHPTSLPGAGTLWDAKQSAPAYLTSFGQHNQYVRLQKNNEGNDLFKWMNIGTQNNQYQILFKEKYHGNHNI